MSMNIRFPNITAASEAEQINQIKSYLHQLVEQLNWALSVLEAGAGSVNTSGTALDYGDISEETFYELKSLLTQATDNLNTYYDRINSKLENQYVKKTEFDALSQEFDDLGNQYVEQTVFDAYKQEVSQAFDDLGDQYVSQDDYDAYKQEVSQQFDDLGNQYVAQTDYDAYKQEVTQQFEDLANQYVAQTDFDAYKQEVTKQFNDLAEQYVAQSDFDAYKQEMSGLDDKYVLKTDYEAYKQEMSSTITDLQGIIDELQQMIGTNQETGGEING